MVNSEMQKQCDLRPVKSKRAALMSLISFAGAGVCATWPSQGGEKCRTQSSAQRFLVEGPNLSKTYPPHRAPLSKLPLTRKGWRSHVRGKVISLRELSLYRVNKNGPGKMQHHQGHIIHAMERMALAIDNRWHV